MLGLLITLVVVAVIAGALGFTGIARGAATLAKIGFALMVVGIVLLLYDTIKVASGSYKNRCFTGT